MITQFLIEMVLGIVEGLFSLIPPWAIDTETITQGAEWGAIVGSANGYVPEQLLFICLAIITAVRLFYLAWDGVIFVYKMIPFNG